MQFVFFVLEVTKGFPQMEADQFACIFVLFGYLFASQPFRQPTRLQVAIPNHSSPNFRNETHEQRVAQVREVSRHCLVGKADGKWGFDVRGFEQPFTY